MRTGGDEFDRLALRINATLDRLRALMAALREVTDDIAHDLRTPLTRLRQRPDGAARALIDKVVVTPGGHPDGSPGIELVGQPMDMLKAARAVPNRDDAKTCNLVAGLSSCSAKGTMRGPGRPISLHRLRHASVHCDAPARGRIIPP